MKKGKATAYIPDNDYEPADEELRVDECADRTLILKAAPPSLRKQLIAQGVKEIRCICCDQIRPLEGAEDSEEGWVCEDCMRAMMPEPRYGGQRGR